MLLLLLQACATSAVTTLSQQVAAYKYNQLRDLQTKGWARVEPVPADVLARWRAAYDSIEPLILAELRKPAWKKAFQRNSVKCNDVCSRTTGRLDIRAACLQQDVYLTEGPMMELARNYMGAVYVRETGFIVSYPGAPPQEMHRDDDRVSAQPRALLVVIALHASTIHNGATQFWSGSHAKDDDCELYEDGALAVEMEVGHVVVWDWAVFHRGMGNLTDQPRALMYVEYIREGSVGINDAFKEAGRSSVFDGPAIQPRSGSRRRARKCDSD